MRANGAIDMIRFESEQTLPSNKPQSAGATGHADDELRLLIEISSSVDADDDWDKTLGLVFDKFCSAKRWDFGQAWAPTADGTMLKCNPSWRGRGDDLNAFRSLSERTTLSLGLGLPGRCCREKQPLWIGGTAVEPNDPRARLAYEVGLKTGVAVPVVDAGEVRAVLEFCSRVDRFDNDRVIELTRAVSAQLGGILRCRRAESRAATLDAQLGDFEHRAQGGLAAAARANKELEQFAYAAAHDLMGPVRSVVGYSQILRDTLRGSLGDDADDCIDSAVAAAQRIQALAHDMLAYSRLAMRVIVPAEVDFECIWRAALERLTATVDSTGAVASADPLPKVVGDQVQLTQLLCHLVDNAIKFRSSAVPRIHLGAQRRGDEWLFSLADNGIGIDARFSERIFVIFQRLHDRTKYPGTGIGLALSKKIVERHGGRIWCESHLDEGATFYFTLPGGTQ